LLVIFVISYSSYYHSIIITILSKQIFGYSIGTSLAEQTRKTDA